MSVQSSLVMHLFGHMAPKEAREKYLPKLATGEYVGCLVTGGTRFRLRSCLDVDPCASVDGGYELTGNKMWITNDPIADVFVVWAKR